MKFTKMHVLGNDIICVIQNENINYNLKMFSKFLCDRHYGIGADAFVIIGKSNIADMKIRCFSSDGNESELNINALICVSKIMYEENIIKKNIFYIETVNGTKKTELLLKNNKIMNIRIDSGKVLSNYKNNIKKFIFKVRDREIIGTGVLYGNYTVIIECENLNEINIEKYGKIIENYKYFFNKVNVEFMQVIDRNVMRIKSWQKGNGIVLSNGNGAIISACLAFEKGIIDKNVTIETDGGCFELLIDEKENKIYLQTDAVKIFSGEIDF